MSAHAHGLVPGVRSIVALRPNAIGDFMFALPALHALRHAYPDAHIALLGKYWHAQFLRHRPAPVDEVIVMPPFPGVGAPPDAEVDLALCGRFIASTRQRGFDLALQMYGGGRHSNSLIRQFQATLSIGAVTPGAAELDRSIPYGPFANRRLELLQIAGLAGAQPRLLRREVEVTAADRAAAAHALPPARGERIVVLHPGATDARRRWPPEHFAAVGDALVRHGAVVAISATESEAGLARAVAGHMQEDSHDLTGRLSLPALCGLLERARMIVSNDTGPLHLALAIGTPAVGIFWLTNLIEACPLAQHLLRPAMALRAHCPVCGAENRFARCAHDVCFVDDVPVELVTSLALDLYCASA